MTALDQALSHFQEIVGPKGIRQGSAAAALDRGVNAHNLDAALVLLPQNAAQVSALLALCHRLGIPVVPQGGRTGLAGGAVTREGQAILALSAMDRIVKLDAAGGTAIVEAGLTLERFEAAANAVGWSAGIDLGARGSCTIGGMVSTNAGGMEAFRFGTMRQRVLGLEVVLPDGAVMSELTEVIKANNGYDIKQLFIGSEGTLGVVTRVALKLVPRKGAVATALIACSTADSAVTLSNRLQRLAGGTAERLEIMWRNHFDITAADHKQQALLAMAPSTLMMIAEVSAAREAEAEAALETALSAALDEGLASDAVLAKSEQERQAFWRLREDWAVDRRFPGGLWYDISLPPPQVERYTQSLIAAVARRDPTWHTFFIGHLGDGNLHVTVCAEQPLTPHYEEVSALVYDGLVACGGSFSAEHGIGLEKKATLAKYGDPTKLALMKAIKAALDPKGIMNLGKVIDLS